MNFIYLYVFCGLFHLFMFYFKSVVISALSIDLDAESLPHKRRKINEEILCSMQVWKFLLLVFFLSFFAFNLAHGNLLCAVFDIHS